jgi:hypothetical protein
VVKVLPPDGVSCMVVVVAWPGLALVGFVSVGGTVKVPFTVRLTAWL